MEKESKELTLGEGRLKEILLSGSEGGRHGSGFRLNLSNITEINCTLTTIRGSSPSSPEIILYKDWDAKEEVLRVGFVNGRCSVSTVGLSGEFIICVAASGTYSSWLINFSYKEV